MNLEITFPAPQWANLQDHLFGHSKPPPHQACDEQMALVLAAPSRSPTLTRLVVRELLLARSDDLAHQSSAGIGPTGEFVAAALTRCRQEGWSFIEVHSHPFTHGSATTFSGIDWSNDLVKLPATARLLPEQALHATMVVGRASLDAHYYDRTSASLQPVHRVSVVGTHDDAAGLTYISPTTAATENEQPFVVEDRHTRQIPLLGSGTQAVLARSTIAIVGLGGLGSFVALELAHLGIGGLVLIDDDAADATNLNRLMGATENDLDQPKVDLYKSLISAISPRTDVKPIPAAILSDEALQSAKQADLILGCVDNHGARLVINQLAVQYLVPLIDAGTGARLDDQRQVTDAGGQVQVVLPGLGCLACRGFIDARQAALDLAPAHVRQREHDHGYGTGEPAPSVVFLNGVVASVQVAEAVKLLSGTAGGKRNTAMSPITRYDLLGQSLTRVAVTADDTCPTCGPDGVAGLADLSPLQHADTLPVPTPAPLANLRP